MSFGCVLCSVCGSTYSKDSRHINQNIKLNHKFYCSKNCFHISKYKQIQQSCANKLCNKLIWRTSAEVAENNFCSQSCSAVFFNTRRWGPPKQKILLTQEEKKARQRAGGILGGKNCWIGHVSIYTKEYVLKEIKDFVKINGRIPVKREVNRLYKSARKYFGIWNNAIEAAGFTPNPVLFATHHKAEDGHICDSLAEKIVDDYLYEHSISHIRNYPYPEGKYTADFKVGELLIEYFGLSGEIKKYDTNLKIKKKLKTKYKLKIIEIFPKDLFPTSFLNKKLSILYPYKWTFH